MKSISEYIPDDDLAKKKKYTDKAVNSVTKVRIALYVLPLEILLQLGLHIEGDFSGLSSPFFFVTCNICVHNKNQLSVYGILCITLLACIKLVHYIVLYFSLFG